FETQESVRRCRRTLIQQKNGIDYGSSGADEHCSEFVISVLPETCVSWMVPSAVRLYCLNLPETLSSAMPTTQTFVSFETLPSFNMTISFVDFIRSPSSMAGAESPAGRSESTN